MELNNSNMEVLNNTPPPEVENMEVLNETPPPQAQNMEVLNDTPPPQVQNMEVHNGTSPRRRRVILWTEEEHRLFLIGLYTLGKGNWKDISKECVVSKTARQVGSHAQKFFSRMNCKTPIGRRRASINDIRTITSNPMTPIIVPMDHQVEAYDNNSFVMDQNPNGHNFEILNHVEAYDNNSFVMDQNPNGNNFEILNQVEASENNLFAMEQNPNNNNNGRFNQAEAYGNNSFVME
ncbi:hypothetical protein KY285_014290 [Solanum tuberosum]|nr:hypothetical protein KY285_014290 [Solanum tuberosum]